MNLADLKMYGRFAWGLRGFLRHTITLEEAKAIVQKRIAERETNFLRLLERGIFGYPKSPYLPLLKLAQVEFGDIRAMVRSKGLENTLRALIEAGVCISFEEFKGRQPIVRSGQAFFVIPSDFDNPHLSHYYQAQTGGTTGAGMAVPTVTSSAVRIARVAREMGESLEGLSPTFKFWRSSSGVVLIRHQRATHGNLRLYEPPGHQQRSLRL